MQETILQYFADNRYREISFRGNSGEDLLLMLRDEKQSTDFRGDRCGWTRRELGLLIEVCNRMGIAWSENPDLNLTLWLREELVLSGVILNEKLSCQISSVTYDPGWLEKVVHATLPV